MGVDLNTNLSRKILWSSLFHSDSILKMYFGSKTHIFHSKLLVDSANKQTNKDDKEGKSNKQTNK